MRRYVGRRFSRIGTTSAPPQSAQRTYTNFTNRVRNPDGSRIRAVDAPLRRSVSDNTMADTPSGYVQDPRVVNMNSGPKPARRMETEDEFNQRKRGEELIIRGIMYYGNCTAQVDDLKLLVLGDPNADLEKLSKARKELEQVLLDFSKREDQCRLQALSSGEDGEPGAASKSLLGEGASANEGKREEHDSCHEQNDLVASWRDNSSQKSIATVRDVTLVEYDDDGNPKQKKPTPSPSAEAIKDMHIIPTDTNHIRLILSYCCRRLGDIQSAKILLDQMREVEPLAIDALQALVELHCCMEGAAGLAHFIPTLNENELMVTYAYVSEMVITLVKGKLASAGEGQASVFALEILGPLRKTLGPQHFSMVVQAILEALQDQIRIAMDQPDIEKRKKNIDAAIIFYKVFLSRQLYKLTTEPIHYHFAILHKFYWGLRFSGRRRESLGVAERLIQFYRKHRQALDTVVTFPTFYQESLFQYVYDRCLENVQISKQLCMELIEEFPTIDKPWRILAVILMRNKEYDDAVIAAKKAVELCMWNKENVLVLYKVYHISNKFNIAAEVRERYVAMAQIEAEGRYDEEELSRFSSDLQTLEDRIDEDDLVESTGRTLREHQFRYDLAHLYTKNADEVEARIAERIKKAREEAEILRGEAIVESGAGGAREVSQAPSAPSS